VNWLYGPLQTGPDRSLKVPKPSSANSNRILKYNSGFNHKPILKKPSISETMFQRSLSESSLVKQEAAKVQARQCRKVARRYDLPDMERKTSECVSLSSLPGLASPGEEKEKRIHFNEQVEQFIALRMPGEEDEGVGLDATQQSEGSDPEDEAMTLKGINSKTKLLHKFKRKAAIRTSFDTNIKMFAILPATTLKYGEDISDPLEAVVRRREGFPNRSELSTPAPEEMLSLLKPSTNISLMDNLEDDDADIDWQPPSLIGDQSCMRCTASGMLMRHGEEESVFEHVVDLVYKVKDIAHLIWHTGLR
jgi:hypothetical protein